MGKGMFNRLQGELQAREKTPGLTMADLLTIPDPLSGLLNWMVRQGQVTFPEAKAFLGQDDACTRKVLTDLIDKGWIREIEIHDVTQYRVRLAPKRGHALPGNLWQALNDKVEDEETRS